MDRVLIGLGNPGSKYNNTKHNVGFNIIDHIAHQFGFDDFGSKYDANISVGQINNMKVALVKPMSYMNNSGIPLSHFIKFFKIAPDKLIVFHDELELETARCKMKLGGGNAGHNGLKSIDQYIGVDYYRVRVGVSRPAISQMNVSDYVLSKFTPDESSKIDLLKQLIIKEMNGILMHQLTNFNSKAGEFFKNRIQIPESVEGA